MKPLTAPPGAFSRPSSASSSASLGAKKTPRYDEYQQAVIECESRVVVAEAFAGAGKTTTAIGYAKARPTAKMLYVCLNKANQVEASARFGSNVECRTSHSLAYAAVGAKFRDQLVGSWKPRALASELKMADTRLAAAVQSVLNQFFSSRDASIDERHVSAAADTFALEPSELNNAIALARMAWTRMQTPGSGMSIPHDAYLKMWALKKPKLSGYTHIILDEAQDTNPVTAGIMEQQTHATRLLIGDRHQSIYLFRGAVNSMEQFANMGATVLKMPRTWRFGPEIAGHANDLLSFFKMEDTEIVGAGPSSTASTGSAKAVLSRTNAGLYAEAAAVMGRNTHWVGGIENARLDLIMSAYHLHAGMRNLITDPVISAYPNWGAFEDDANQSRDGEARMLIKLVEEYKKHTPSLVKAFRANALPTQEGAKLVLSTAHKAKGLDWDTVKVGDDFSCIDDAISARMANPLQRMDAAMEQEINLLYVAITRARKKVELNKETADFIKHYSVHASSLMEAAAAANGCGNNSSSSDPIPGQSPGCSG